MKRIEGALDMQLTADSPQLVERAIALADIGTAGIDGPSKYLPEGDAIFREEQLDVVERLKDPVQREDMKKRMLEWSKIQIDFAQGRKARLDSELKGLSEEMANNVRKLFSRFDDSIEAAQLQYSVREKMTPEELAKSFGYTPPKYTIH